MSSERVRSFDRLAEWYGDSLSRPDFLERFALYESWLRRVYAASEHPPTCLDLGCGPGTLAVKAAQVGFRTIGVDGSGEMLEQARRLAASHGVQLDLRRAEIPLPEPFLREQAGKFDLLIASSVIEYVEDDREMVAQCRRLLSSRGVLLMSFANRHSLLRRLERRGVRRRWVPTTVFTAARRHHSQDEARHLFEDQHLRVTDVTYFAMRAPIYRLWRSSRRPRWLASLFLVAAALGDQVQAAPR